jgi:hypothetical protein
MMACGTRMSKVCRIAVCTERMPFGSPLAIARWMAQTLRSGQVPHLWAYPSSAVRLSRAALDVGIDLRGAQFTITGEPVITCTRNVPLQQRTETT